MTTAAPAVSIAAAGSNAEDLDAIEALLGRHGLDQTYTLDPTATRRWALTDLLADDFARSRGLAARVRSLVRGANRSSSGPLQMMRERHWLEKMERRAATARLRNVPAHQARRARKLAFDIPLADHPLVDTYVDYFTGKGRWFFKKWLARAGRYQPLMQRILRQAGMPEDTFYLAMIESGLAASATSSAAAVGFWQFIQPTGKRFNLTQTFWLDERRDFVLATRAAARYLRVLYDEFGDWHLAWASYNAGEGRIRRALAKYGEDDFWGLVEHSGSLPKETVHYVPKIIAAAIVAKNHERFGFNDVAPQKPFVFESLSVQGAVDLRRLAESLGIDYKRLRQLNPGYLQGITPPERRATLRVPKGSRSRVARWLKRNPPKKRYDFAHYEVRRGDTLYAIARRFDTSMVAIRDFNHIENAQHILPGQNLIIPGVQKGQRGRRAQARKLTHTVRPGETLWSIAQRYGVSVRRLKSWNERRSNVIKVGERLRVYRSES